VRVAINFLKILHGFLPKRLEAGGEAQGELAVSHQHGCEAPFRDEWVIEGENRALVIEDVEGMPELTGITNARDLGEVLAVRP